MAKALKKHNNHSHGSWNPSIWKEYPTDQMPHYTQPELAESVLQRISKSRPLVRFEDIQQFQHELLPLYENQGFWLQMGDCAESISPPTPTYAYDCIKQIQALGQNIESELKRRVISVARIAGQFAKPRSHPQEKQHSVALPSYRGDLINGQDFNPNSRHHDPERLWQGYVHARTTLDTIAPLIRAGMAVSHEALHLGYEQALCRQDSSTGLWYLGSAHTVWLGNQTQNMTGGHVAFLKGISNPIGIKCGPSLSAATLYRLINILNPLNIQGKIILVCRIGRDTIEATLPTWIDMVIQTKRKVLWVCDPMHGNTRKHPQLKKIRVLDDMIQEIVSFNQILGRKNLYPHGLHLESAPYEDVSECYDHELDIAASHVGENSGYKTLCDPRLNPRQCWKIVDVMLDCMSKLQSL